MTREEVEEEERKRRERERERRKDQQWKKKITSCVYVCILVVWRGACLWLVFVNWTLVFEKRPKVSPQKLIIKGFFYNNQFLILSQKLCYLYAAVCRLSDLLAACCSSVSTGQVAAWSHLVNVEQHSTMVVLLVTFGTTICPSFHLLHLLSFSKDDCAEAHEELSWGHWWTRTRTLAEGCIIFASTTACKRFFK